MAPVIRYGRNRSWSSTAFFQGLPESRLPPHPNPLLPHLKIDNNSLKSDNTTERNREYVESKALIEQRAVSREP